MTSPLRIPALLAVVLATAVGCASTPTSDEWRDASLPPRFLAGSTVAVACEAPDLPLQNLCRDQLAAAVLARGARAIFLPDGVALPIDARALPTARAAQAKAIVVLALRPLAVDTGPAFSIGIGGFGLGRNSAVGGGVSAPIGPNRVETAWSVNGRIVDVAAERVVWTATRNGKPSDDAAGQVADLGDAVIAAAQRAGLF